MAKEIEKTNEHLVRRIEAHIRVQSYGKYLEKCVRRLVFM